jgi:peptide methionine sulfoxide reductase MsrB
MNNDLIEKAKRYAQTDDYHVTRKIITDLCNEIDRLRELNKNVFSRIQDNQEVFKNAERYNWLCSASWDVNPEIAAPSVILCNGDMTKWQWMLGKEIDEAIDKYLDKE